MAGIVWIPRMLDKARASLKDQLGEYKYPCPMDQMALDYLQLNGEEFTALAESKTDAEMELWLKDFQKTRSAETRYSLNQDILGKEPDTREKKEYFRKLRDEIDPTRGDIKTWAALIDLEEGHAG